MCINQVDQLFQNQKWLPLVELAKQSLKNLAYNELSCEEIFCYLVAARKTLSKELYNNLIKAVDGTDKMFDKRILEELLQGSLDFKNFSDALRFLNCLKDIFGVVRLELNVLCLCQLDRLNEARELVRSAHESKFEVNDLNMAKGHLSFAERDFSEARCFYSLVDPIALLAPFADNYLRFFQVQTDLEFMVNDLPSEKEILSQWGSFNSPVVTVVVPTYQQEKYCRYTLAGILRQKTKYPYEILVHDDASQDDTQSILFDFKEKYPSIIKLVVRKENIYQQGKKPLFDIEHMLLGKYVAKCEGDDFWLDEHKLETQINIMENNEDVVMCFHHPIIHNEIKCNTWVEEPENERDQSIIFHSQEDVILKRHELPYVHTRVFRSELKSKLPIECSKVILGDQFNSSVLGLFGKVAEINNFPASASRRNSESSWQPMSAGYKEVNRFGYRAWLAVFYARQGYFDYSRYFYEQACEYMPLAEVMELILKAGSHPLLLELEKVLVEFESLPKHWR